MDTTQTLKSLQLAAIKRLKLHDWHYEMSNSYNIWTKGNKDMKEIEEMLSFFTFERAQYIFNEYSSDDFAFTETQYNNAKKRIDKRLTSVDLNTGV